MTRNAARAAPSAGTLSAIARSVLTGVTPRAQHDLTCARSLITRSHIGHPPQPRGRHTRGADDPTCPCDRFRRLTIHLHSGSENNGPDGSAFLLNERKLEGNLEITCAPTGWARPEGSGGRASRLPPKTASLSACSDTARRMNKRSQDDDEL